MILDKLVRGEGISDEEAEGAMEAIMDGSYGSARTAAFLVALRMKGETPGEITALAKVMRRHAISIRPDAKPLVDTCGTGGDCSNTFNVSTAAAFIAAGSGIAIAKHGNKAVSGKCGSADVLEELGVKMLGPEGAARCIGSIGIGFLFAPLFHPSMKNAMPVRRELGIRTVFNVLGPLANPANADAQVLGVYSPSLCMTLAEVLGKLGTKRALVVHSDGMDEIGLGKTRVAELRDGRVEQHVLDASVFGIGKRMVPTANSREEASRILLSVLEGKEGPALDVSLLNAAAAIYAGGRATGIQEGLEMARASVESGAAMKKLQMLREFGGN